MVVNAPDVGEALAHALHGVTAIVCFYTGPALPRFVAPMLRNREPASGEFFDERFGELFADACGVNPTVEDGAVMIGRATVGDPYRICGWSYRLFPPPSGLEGPPNLGSGFNSCLELSVVPTVDLVVKSSDDGFYLFERGKWSFIRKPAPSLAMGWR